jgi:signal transduction histidine kinase
LATELNLAEQQERKRLATELHDHLQHLLVLAKLKVGQGKRYAETIPALTELLKQLDDALSQALRYTRTLVAELSPPVLRDYGLAAALKWLSEYMHKLSMTVMVHVPESSEFRLPEDQAVLLFQSVRELLINCYKYAGTSRATVLLEQREGQLRIEVRDEGVGFDPIAATPAEVPAGGGSSKFGLFSIRERMTALGGSFDMRSAPGQGTTATLILPVSPSSP